MIGVFFLTVSNAKGEVITADDGWHGFSFPGLLNPVAPEDYSWFDIFEFTLTLPAILTVQDLGDSTDQFSVFDNGSFIFNTSEPSGCCVGDIFNPDIAAGIPELSHGSFLLEPGTHIITGTNNRFASTDFGGAGALRVDTIEINEPNIISLLFLSTFIWVVLSFLRRSESHLS